MRKESIVIFRNQLEALCGLTSIKDVKTVVRAIIDYGMNGETEIDMPEHLLFGWNAIKFQLDDVAAHEEAIRSKRTAAASKRWADDANACKSKQEMQMHANGCKSMQMHANDANGCTKKTGSDNNNNNNINNINNNTQEIFEEKEKEKIKKEKKENDCPGNYKQWSIHDFTASVDEAIFNHPEYADHRDAFLRYWSEPDPKGRMRFALQKTWLTAGRLATWARNNNNGWNNNAGERNDGNNGCNKPGSEGSFGRYVPRNG